MPIKETLVASAFAIAVAFGGAAQAQQAGFQQGWNEVQVTNCELFLATPASGATPAQPLKENVYVNVIQGPQDPNNPPPPPDSGMFTVTDQTLISFSAPWCKTPGGLFFVFMNNNTPLYLSAYPR